MKLIQTQIIMKGKKLALKTCKCISEKGFTTAEIIISIIIIILFTSIIVSAYYNYYISVQSKNRKTIATNIIIDIIENVEMMEYDNITQDSVNSLIENLKTNNKIPSGYTVTINLQNYNKIAGNEDKIDIIKILKTKVEYIVNNKQQDFEITRLITKQN